MSTGFHTQTIMSTVGILLIVLVNIWIREHLYHQGIIGAICLYYFIPFIESGFVGCSCYDAVPMCFISEYYRRLL